jgi:acetyl-CoA synthetase
MADAERLRRWEEAAEHLAWRRRWDAVYEPGGQGGRWFPGGRLNAAENCVERHLPTLGGKVAFYWEGEPGDRKTITYDELHTEVCAFAEALRGLGVKPGDRVALYMGIIPETVVAMLACARVGAVHAVMASALPADALADRLADVGAKVLVTQDGSWRHGVILPLKARADEAIPAAAVVEHTIVVRRIGIDVPWYEGDRWYDDVVARPRPGAISPIQPSEPIESSHPLLIAYIANRRGRPTGIVHGTGGFLTCVAAVHRDGLCEGRDDVLWMPSEIAWIGGQSSAIYGPLACGGTSVLFEGMLDTPTHARSWELIERYGVTTLATTPSVFRNLRRWADSPPNAEQLRSLRRVVTAGEPLEADLREWVHDEIAGASAVVADAWGQTELGGIVILSDRTGDSGDLPDPGPDVVDEHGSSVAPGVKGELVLREPWPGTFVGVENEASPAERPWHCYDGLYATGDSAVRKPEGGFLFLGRIDPVTSMSGQLVSLTEVRAALLEHPFVEDAEVVDPVDSLGAQTLGACVVLADPTAGDPALAQSLRDHLRERLGGLAQPRVVLFVHSFPPDVPEDGLRQALRMLCATDAVEAVVTAEQLRAAARGAMATTPTPVFER